MLLTVLVLAGLGASAAPQSAEPVDAADSPIRVRTAPAPATAPSPAPTLIPDRSRAPQPIREAQWMNRLAQSYPARALAAGLEGSVAVSLTVSSGGRVSACRVTQSSGEAVLDEAACTAFARYARFRPALDPQGQPTRGLYSTSVRYSLS